MDIKELEKIRDQINSLIKSEKTKPVRKTKPQQLKAFKDNLQGRTMTVAEVINFLKKFDGDMPFFGGHTGEFGTLTWIVNLCEDNVSTPYSATPVVKGIRMMLSLISSDRSSK